VHRPQDINLDITVFQIPNIDCWQLTCPAGGVFAADNGKITYESSGFADEISVNVNTLQGTYLKFTGDAVVETKWKDCFWWYTEICVTSYKQWNFDKISMNPERQISVEVYGGAKKTEQKKLLSYSTAPCDNRVCSLNTQKTRGLSSMYATVDDAGYTVHDTTTYPHLTRAKLETVVQNVIKSTEDYLSDVAYSPVCTENPIDPNKISTCKNDVYKIEASQVCTDDD